MDEGGFDFKNLQFSLNCELNVVTLATKQNRFIECTCVCVYVCLKLYIDYCSWLIFKVFLQVYWTFCRLFMETVNSCTQSQNLHAMSVADQIRSPAQLHLATTLFISPFVCVYAFDIQLVSFLCRCSSLCAHNINGQNYPSIGTMERKRRTYFLCVFRTITLNNKMLTNVRKSWAKILNGRL